MRLTEKPWMWVWRAHCGTDDGGGGSVTDDIGLVMEVPSGVAEYPSGVAEYVGAEARYAWIAECCSGCGGILRMSIVS